MKQLFKIALLSGTMLAATSTMSFADEVGVSTPLGGDGFGVFDRNNIYYPDKLYENNENHPDLEYVTLAGGHELQVVVIGMREKASDTDPSDPGIVARKYRNHFCKVGEPVVGSSVSRSSIDFEFSAAAPELQGPRVAVEMKWYDENSKTLPAILVSQGITKLKKGEGRFVLETEDLDTSDDGRAVNNSIVFPVTYRGIRSFGMMTERFLSPHLPGDTEPSEFPGMEMIATVHMANEDLAFPSSAPFPSDWYDDQKWEHVEFSQTQIGQPHNRIASILDFGFSTFEDDSYSEIAIRGIEMKPSIPDWKPEPDTPYWGTIGLVCFTDYIEDE